MRKGEPEGRALMRGAACFSRSGLGIGIGQALTDTPATYVSQQRRIQAVCFREMTGSLKERRHGLRLDAAKLVPKMAW
jgi:hypothetical protein